MTKRFNGLCLLLLVALALGAAGCAAQEAFSKGEKATQRGDLDQAVAAYRDAVHASPDNANYKIALQRAQQAASRAHIEKAKDFEAHDQLEAALGEYRAASDYDPSNRMAIAKAVELDRTIKEHIEAARPKPAIQQMRERARQQSAEPILNPASREPINVRINNQSLRDALTSLGAMTGINFTFDREVADRSTTIALDGVTLEQALNQIMTMNQLSYKVLSERSIFVFPDTAPKHAQYDEQVIRTFYLSHADSTEVMQILSTIIRLPGIAVQPAIAGNKTANTITVRGTSSVVQILEKIIEQNDKPRAEIVVDVEIMEVDRSRSKNYGLELTDYSLGAIFSPEVNPSGSTASTGTTGTPGTGTTTTATGTSTAPSAVKSPPPFNLNTISRGISTADFYMAVPAAIVHFMEGDSRTKIIAKPQLRGAEGAKLTLKLGTQIPIISTSYTPIATGGAGVNPLSSYQYKDVGVNIDMTPTVTLEGEIRLDLTVDSSSRGADVVIGGVNIPSFVQRTATTRLRLRDGESNLLAGLYQENDQSQITGFPGAIHVPLLTSLFSHNTGENDQVDIVMLLTPHIVRTHEITIDDLKPIYIGSQQNLGIGGPQQLFAPGVPDGPAIQPQAPAAPPAAAPGPGFQTPTPPNQISTGPVAGRGPGGSVVSAPPGSSPVPGTVMVQPAPNTAIITGPPGPPVVIPADPNAAAAAQPGVTPATSPTSVATPPAAPATTTPATGDATPPRDTLPSTSQGIGSAQVLISPPGTAFRVGSTYTVPISISDATRISTITLTLIFDPAKLRVNRVSEGSFMRAGGVNVTFSQQVNGNRVDITLTRGADTTGATGTGLLAAILFDAIAPGGATLTLSGSATGPGGTAMGLRFTPVTVQVQ